MKSSSPLFSQIIRRTETVANTSLSVPFIHFSAQRISVWVYNIIYNSLAEPSQDSSIRTGGFVFLFHEANGTPNCFPRNGKFIFLRLRALSSATGETGVAYSKINWIPSAMISPSILNIRQHFLLSWI